MVTGGAQHELRYILASVCLSTEAPYLEMFPRLLCSLASVCRSDSCWELSTPCLWGSGLTLPMWQCRPPVPLPHQRETEGPQMNSTVCSEQCLPLSSAPVSRRTVSGFKEHTHTGDSQHSLMMNSVCLSLPHRSDHLCGYVSLHACIILFQGMLPSPTTC